MQTEVDRGGETIGETIDTLEAVVERTVAVNDGIQEVDAAADQQATSTQEVVSLIDDVSAIADKTATQTDEIAGAADRQRTTVSEVTGAVRSFADEAATLREYLGDFETDTETTSEQVAATAD
jgi:methyl-accepting chemotaxis protein